MDEQPQITREEVEKMKRTILRLCRERARPFGPIGAGRMALDELLAEGLVERERGDVYALTDRGKAT